jgi:hypothetical protein
VPLFLEIVSAVRISRREHWTTRKKSGEQMKRILLAVLCTIMILGVWVEQSAGATVTLRTTLLRNLQGGGCVIRLKEAGIQFLVPPGWEVETDKGGVVTFSKFEGNNFIVASIRALPPESSNLTPELQFKAASEGVFSSAKQDYQDFKLGASQKVTLNRMPLTSQLYSGKRQGIDVTGVLAVLQANKPVIIFSQATMKVSATLVEEASNLINSAKKIE